MHSLYLKKKYFFFNKSFGEQFSTLVILQKFQMLGKIEGRRKRRDQRMRWLDSTTTDAMNMNLGKLWDLLRDRGPSVHEPTVHAESIRS